MKKCDHEDGKGLFDLPRKVGGYDGFDIDTSIGGSLIRF